MVHHYLEEKAESETTDSTEKIKFSATIDAPYSAAPSVAAPTLERQPECCFPSLAPERPDTLLQALPTLLVAIGLAYTLGVVSGVLISNPALE